MIEHQWCGIVVATTKIQIPGARNVTIATATLCRVRCSAWFMLGGIVVILFLYHLFHEPAKPTLAPNSPAIDTMAVAGKEAPAFRRWRKINTHGKPNKTSVSRLFLNTTGRLNVS